MLNFRRWLASGQTQERVVGILSILFCLFLIAVWIPADVESGLAETVRGRSKIGDALAPTLAAVSLGLGGLAVLLSASTARNEETFERANFYFIAGITILILLACGLMFVAGPLVVNVAQVVQPDLPEYRVLRNTLPWKYIGYLAGGVGMLVGLFLVTGFGTWRQKLLTAIIVILALALAYDLPFDDLLLPPNGDI